MYTININMTRLFTTSQFMTEKRLRRFMEKLHSLTNTTIQQLHYGLVFATTISLETSAPREEHGM